MSVLSKIGMKRNLATAGLAAGVALTLVACSGGGDSGGSGGGRPAKDSLSIAMATEAPTYDPVVSPQVQATEIIRNVFETLVTVDSKFDIQPMLAESYKVGDGGKSIDFTLRKGVKFHDGSTMTADDVVSSMNRWIKYSSAGKAAVPDGEFTKTSDDVVVLTTAKPSPVTLLDLAYGDSNLPAIMPAKIADAAGEKSVTEYVGTGPFSFVTWNKGTSIELKKFDGYSARTEKADALSGNRTPAYKDLTYDFVADAATRQSGLESGQYDLIEDVSLDSVSRLESEGLKVRTTPTTNLPNVYFNKAKGFFTNVKARKAVSVGIDRDALLKAGWLDPRFYAPTAGFLPKALSNLWASSLTGDSSPKPELAQAKTLLAEAGYSGQTVTLLSSKDTTEVYNQTIVLQQQLEAMGVKTKISTFDYATMLARRDDPSQWDIIVVQNVAKIEPTQQSFLRPDFAGWTKDPALDAVLAKFQAAPDLDAAKKIYAEFDAWYQDYVPVANIGSVSSAFATAKNVKGANADGGTAITVWGVTFE